MFRKIALPWSTENTGIASGVVHTNSICSKYGPVPLRARGFTGTNSSISDEMRSAGESLSHSYGVPVSMRIVVPPGISFAKLMAAANEHGFKTFEQSACEVPLGDTKNSDVTTIHQSSSPMIQSSSHMNLSINTMHVFEQGRE